MSFIVSPRYQLFENVHKNLAPPSADGDTFLTRESYLYCHYCCDAVNDVGYGCGYRTIQSICSMLRMRKNSDTPVPSLRRIQETLVEIGDKERHFVGSREWIGSLEASFIFDELYGTPSYIVHVSHSQSLSSQKKRIVEYFERDGGLIFLGGDCDAAAKLITGIHVSSDDAGMWLQVVDPHFSGVPKSVDDLIERSYIKWYSENDFVETSFYNLCMPKLT